MTDRPELRATMARALGPYLRQWGVEHAPISDEVADAIGDILTDMDRAGYVIIDTVRAVADVTPEQALEAVGGKPSDFYMSAWELMCRAADPVLTGTQSTRVRALAAMAQAFIAIGDRRTSNGKGWIQPEKGKS